MFSPAYYGQEQELSNGASDPVSVFFNGYTKRRLCLMLSIPPTVQSRGHVRTWKRQLQCHINFAAHHQAQSDPPFPNLERHQDHRRVGLPHLQRGNPRCKPVRSSLPKGPYLNRSDQSWKSIPGSWRWSPQSELDWDCSRVSQSFERQERQSTLMIQFIAQYARLHGHGDGCSELGLGDVQ